ncbi:MAG: glycosyltransferase family 9 protein [Thermodesulfobacteriota bacterium]
MLIQDIPYHLRNTVERLTPPIYIDLTPEACRPPANLAVGDTLMVLGLLRNQGRPVRLHLAPSGSLRELVASHPLVAELTPPDDAPPRLDLVRVPVGRAGRGASWLSTTTLEMPMPVLPVDQVRANPILAHSRYYGLERADDRPSVFIDPARPPALAGLLMRGRPTLVAYPLNPGRSGHLWQDPAWWRELLTGLRREMAVVLVGAADYGELAQAADAQLPMDDPGSTLLDLAWLISRAAAFVGGDGGLCHLAAAVNPRRLTVWDSMASYRVWAGAGGHHVLFSNPYTFRYPQTVRHSLTDLGRIVAQRGLPDGRGGWRPVDLGAGGLQALAAEHFGGVEALARAVMAQQEVEAEREFVAGWMGQAEARRRIYAESLDFAGKALRGQLAAGANWVVPAWP